MRNNLPYKDFVCKNCGAELVNIKKNIYDDTKPICPKCNIEMEQVYYTLNFSLQGDGWTGNSGRGRKK